MSSPSSAPAPAPSSDAMSKKALAKWGREEMSRIQEAFSDTLFTPDGMNIKLLEAVSQRAMHYSEQTSKFLVRSHFPLPSGISSLELPGTPPGLRIFPAEAQVQEVWISFADKSLLFLAIPSEKNRAFGRFLATAKKTPAVAQAMGLDEDGIAQAREIITLSEHKRFLAPMNEREFQEFLVKKRHQFSLIPPQIAPYFEINASTRRASPLEMLDALESFADNPAEFSWQKSVGDWIGSTYGNAE